MWRPGRSLAAKYITLRKSVRVIPLGIAMGLIVLVMNFVDGLWLAVPLLIIIGGLSGFFVVPMNALLQHRGHILMGAGHSIAVQNFNENISILVMTGLYYMMIKIGPVDLLGGDHVRAIRQRPDVHDPPAPPQPTRPCRTTYSTWTTRPITER